MVNSKWHSSHLLAITSSPSQLGSVLLLEPPDGDPSVIAAGGQESRLLRVPGDTVHVLAVSSGHLSSQREHGLVWIGRLVLLEHSHGIVTTGSCEGASQPTPKQG